MSKFEHYLEMIEQEKYYFTLNNKKTLNEMDSQNSCSIDSCDADILKSQKTIDELLKDIRYGINIIKKDIKNPKFKDFVPDELKSVEKALQDILNRKDITNNQKIEIKKEIITVNNLKKETQQ